MITKAGILLILFYCVLGQPKICSAATENDIVQYAARIEPRAKLESKVGTPVVIVEIAGVANFGKMILYNSNRYPHASGTWVALSRLDPSNYFTSSEDILVDISEDRWKSNLTQGGEEQKIKEAVAESLVPKGEIKKSLTEWLSMDFSFRYERVVFYNFTSPPSSKGCRLTHFSVFVSDKNEILGSGAPIMLCSD